MVYLIWGETEYEGQRLIAVVSSLERAERAVNALNAVYKKHMAKVRSAIEKDRDLPTWPLKDISEDQIYYHTQMTVDSLPKSLAKLTIGEKERRRSR